MTTTKKGYELAELLAPAIGYTHAISETCSLICRAAATLHRLNEEECNGHPAQAMAHAQSDWTRIDKLQEKWDERIELESARVTKRLDSLVRDLPIPSDTNGGLGGSWKLALHGDPRGCAVEIIAPDDVPVRHGVVGEVKISGGTYA